MIPQALILYIETEIIPRYEQFDKAHNLLHVQKASPLPNFILKQTNASHIP